MEQSKIKPEATIKQIVVWFASLILLEWIFLTGARVLKDSQWLSATLVITAIVLVPVFLVTIFRLQTKFRSQFLDDSYYAEWLKMQEEQFKDFTPEQLKDFAPSGSLSAKLVSSNLLRVYVLLPSLLNIDDYFDSVADRLKAITFVYTIFAILVSKHSNAITGLVNYLSEQKIIATISSQSLYQFLTVGRIEPLRLTTAHYGSPALFDLLGVGKALEILKDTIKDLAWRGKHEKHLADLELRKKQAEITKDKLEIEKVALELATHRLEIEKATVEIATKKIELLEKIAGFQLPDSDKRMIISALIPKMVLLSEIPIALLKDESKVLISSDKQSQ